MTTLSLSLSLFISMRVETLWRFDEKFDEKCLVLCVGFLKTPTSKKKWKKSHAHTSFSFFHLFIHQKERETNKNDDGRGVITIVVVVVVVVVVAGNIALPFFKRRI